MSRATHHRTAVRVGTEQSRGYESEQTGQVRVGRLTTEQSVRALQNRIWRVRVGRLTTSINKSGDPHYKTEQPYREDWAVPRSIIIRRQGRAWGHLHNPPPLTDMTENRFGALPHPASDRPAINLTGTEAVPVAQSPQKDSTGATSSRQEPGGPHLVGPVCGSDPGQRPHPNRQQAGQVVVVQPADLLQVIPDLAAMLCGIRRCTVLFLAYFSQRFPWPSWDASFRQEAADADKVDWSQVGCMHVALATNVN